LHLDLTTGQLVAGSLVTVTATGLEANSLLVITVHSTPMTLLTTHVGPDGSYTGSVALPSGLEDGMHEVMASGVAGGVTSQVLGGFVESKGVATSVVQPGPVTTPIVPNDPRLVQALRYHRSAYNIAADPSSGSAVLVTGTAILAIAGAGGIAGERRRQQKKASVSSAVTKKLKGLKIEGARLGDRSLTWRFPFTSWTDKIGQVWPGVVGRYSAVAPRVLLDGTWARAMFGSGALLLWLAGIVTALVACTAHGSSGLAPAFPLLVAMVVLGIFDAAAGAAAWLTIAVVTLVTGGFETWSDLRTLLGLGVLFATISLLAHVIRPLRRNLESGADERAERFFDFVMMPPFVAFASGSMLKALNGLSGLTLVTPVEISHFRWIVYGVILARLALEDVVHRLYPERAQTVQPDKLVSPTRRWTSVALVTRAAIYILVGVPFFGLSATLFIAAILLSVPAILKIFEDNLPNSVKLNKWLPRGLLMFFCSMVIGIVLAWDLEGSHPTPAVVRSTFLLLLIPGIIAGMLELFGREGGAWKKGKHQWLLGGAVWLSALGIVTGHLLLFPTIHVA
jgi:hypothetical protein